MHKHSYKISENRISAPMEPLIKGWMKTLEKSYEEWPKKRLNRFKPLKEGFMGIRIVFCLVIIFLVFPIHAMSVDISAPASNTSYTSILYKYFRLNDYTSDNFEGQVHEVKIILRTNSHESDWDFDHLKFHKVFLTALESERFGWHSLFLPTSFNQHLNAEGWEQVGISGGITAFRPTRPNLDDRKWLTPIVDYDLGMKGDIELDFPSRNKLTIMARLSVMGDDPLWNTMKYRGEPLDKFVKKVIRKFEEKLKDKYNLVDMKD